MASARALGQRAMLAALVLATLPLVGSATRLASRSSQAAAGDFDRDGRDDVHWYAAGATTVPLWWSAVGPLASDEPAAVDP